VTTPPSVSSAQGTYTINITTFCLTSFSYTGGSITSPGACTPTVVTTTTDVAPVPSALQTATTDELFPCVFVLNPEITVEPGQNCSINESQSICYILIILDKNGTFNGICDVAYVPDGRGSLIPPAQQPQNKLIPFGTNPTTSSSEVVTATLYTQPSETSLTTQSVASSIIAQPTAPGLIESKTTSPSKAQETTPPATACATVTLEDGSLSTITSCSVAILSVQTSADTLIDAPSTTLSHLAPSVGSHTSIIVSQKPASGSSEESPAPPNTRTTSETEKPIAVPQTSKAAVGQGSSNPTTAAPQLPLTTVVPIINIGGTPVTGNGEGGFVISSQTLAPGGVITLSDASGTTTLSLPSSSGAIVINGATSIIKSSANVTPTPHPVLTIAGSILTANSASQFIIDGQTLSPGSAITINGAKGQTTLSLAPSATAVVVNGLTTTLATSLETSSPELPVLTIAGTAITANSASDFVIGGKTLAPGQAITVTGSNGLVETISLSPSATAVVINGKTSTFSTPPTTAAPLPLLTLGGSVITADAQSDFVIGGQTLAPGSQIVVSGTTLSYEANSSGHPGIVVVAGTGGTTTETLATSTPTSTGTSGIVESTGRAPNIVPAARRVFGALMLGLGVGMLLS
jgi:hypothetical protein